MLKPLIIASFLSTALIALSACVGQVNDPGTDTENLLVNADFEINDDQSWGFWQNIASVESCGRASSRGMQLDSSFHGGAFQNVVFEAGERYQLSGWGRMSTNQTEAIIGVHFKQGSEIVFEKLIRFNSLDFEYQETEFIAPNQSIYDTSFIFMWKADNQAEFCADDLILALDKTDKPEPKVVDWDNSSVFEIQGLRALTLREYDASVATVLGDNTKPGARLLPADAFAPFDNSRNEEISLVKVKAIERAAIDIVDRLMSNDARRNATITCQPSSNVDSDCMAMVVDSIGGGLFRRALSEQDRQDYVNLGIEQARQKTDFLAGVAAVIKGLLQDPAFLYRWEIGTETPTPGKFKLSDTELASRLAFTLWGSAPDAELNRAAQAGELSNPTSYAALVEKMLNDKRALDLVDFFHAAWLGYVELQNQSALSTNLRTETRALLEETIFNNQSSWFNVLLSDQTYINDELANHYDFPERNLSGFYWTKYPNDDRRGLVSHGSFLTIGSKFGDTSPVQRGYDIRKALFCEQIPSPPPDIDVDEPPGESVESPCKLDKHLGSTLKPGVSCISCHQFMDGIGFGLENYNAVGKFRSAEPDHPECIISGDGDTVNYGTFNGPAELAELIVNSERAEVCLIQRFAEFTGGRVLNENDEALKVMTENFRINPDFKAFITQLVTSEGFRHRYEGVE